MLHATTKRVGASLIKDLDILLGRRKAHILPMVVSIASHEWKKSGSPVDYEDVVGEAILGALKADKGYKKGRGAKFSTYAFTRVQGAVLDLIRREASNGRKHVLCDPATLASVVDERDGLERNLAMQQQFRQALTVIARELDPRSRAIIVMFYLQNKQGTEVAKKLRCSEGQVSKARMAALGKAKLGMQKRGHYAVVE